MTMNKEIFVKLLAQRQFQAVRSILDVMNEVDIASLLSDLEDKELAACIPSDPQRQSGRSIRQHESFHAVLSRRDFFREGIKRTH